MIWRERIAAARERGAFTEDDFTAWRSPATCLIGETVEHYVDYFSEEGVHFYRLISSSLCKEMGISNFQEPINTALYCHDFSALEGFLDQIEDRALELKREYCQPAG